MSAALAIVTDQALLILVEETLMIHSVPCCCRLPSMSSDNASSQLKDCDPRPHLNLVFIGHVDAGKSTTCGNIMYLSGSKGGGGDSIRKRTSLVGGGRVGG